MKLIQTGLLNSIAVGIRILTAIGLNKILAIHIGPSGFALLGQLQNFIAMVTNISGSAMNRGVIKYTAEYNNDHEKQTNIWKTAGTIGAIASIGFGIIIVFARDSLSILILKDNEYSSIFIWFGAALFLFMANALIIAILNGKKEIGRYVTIKIIGNIISLIISGGLAIIWGVYGALVAMTINQSLILFVTLVFCFKRPWFKVTYLIGAIDNEATKNLAKFGLITVVSALVGPITQIFIRNHLGNSFSWDIAGEWQALNRISKIYLMLVTTPLAVYYLPRMSEIRSRSGIVKELLYGYKIILPIVISGAMVIYFTRNWIVASLFTAEFNNMTKMFFWQMCGDVVRIGSWLLAYVMLSKAMVRMSIATEIIFSISLILFTLLFTSVYGFVGAQLGYFINYLFYWVTVFVLLRINRTI